MTESNLKINSVLAELGSETAQDWLDRTLPEMEDPELGMQEPNGTSEEIGTFFGGILTDYLDAMAQDQMYAGSTGGSYQPVAFPRRKVVIPRQPVGLKTTDRGSGQTKIKGKSASEEAGKLGYVWAHFKALVLGGSQTEDNMGAASNGANRIMIPFELGAAAAARTGSEVEFGATVTLIGDVVETFESQIWINDVCVLDGYVDGDAENPTRDEMSFWLQGIPATPFKKTKKKQ